MRSYDVAVVGAGPAGEGAAMKAAKCGKSVAMIEGMAIGGSCTHLGTIPSKALRHYVRQSIRYQRNPVFTTGLEASSLTWPALLKKTSKVIDMQVDVRSRFYSKNRVDVLAGHAHFEDEHNLIVQLHDGARERICAKQIVLAVGSSPYQPGNVDFSHERVYDSDSILSMEHTPRHIIIYGAGVIGCEYASIFCGLGIKVDLINSREHLLDFLDQEITDALSYHLREQGVTIRHSEEYESISADSSRASIHLKSGKQIHADALLWCNGRSGNTSKLKLEAAGLEANSRGLLTVNEFYQTDTPHIYAAGDVVGWPSLASAAYDQGRSAASHFVGEEMHFINDVPTGIYTIPGISSVGQTEKELTQAKVPYEVGQVFFKTLARAQITGETTGMLKLLFHRETLEILGVHCFGYQASEIIHIGQTVMNQKGDANSIAYFIDTTFNYPTMAEAYRVAALNGLYRLE